MSGRLRQSPSTFWLPRWYARGVVIFGIDPSLRSTGYAVIESKGGRQRAVAYGTIPNPPSRLVSLCFREIHRMVGELLDAHHPDAVAIEAVIYVQSRGTAITLGGARGAAITAVAAREIPVFEYPSRFVKKASTGFGGAAKAQVGFMMRAVLGLSETPPADAADALAIALTHVQSYLSNGERLGVGRRI